MLAGQNAPHTVDGLGAPAIADYLNSHTTAGEVIATDAMPDDIIQERISNMENNLNVILANIGLGLDFTGLQAVDGIVAAEE
jgi:hypothetical protein